MFQETKELTLPQTKHYCIPKWRGDVQRARKRGYFDATDATKAASWNRCAVGEAQHTYGEASILAVRVQVMDTELDWLGRRFAWVVRTRSQRFDEAEEIISKIEERLLQLDYEKEEAKKRYA